jgi:RimJ/RimL family protein N-acetyltransferase
VQDSSDELIRDQTWYHGPDTYAYGCIEKSRIVGVCYVWYGERYRARNYWPLSDDEAKIVQLITIPEMRGRGIGTDLIAYSANDILQKGFRRIYSRVWHSNLPSCRAMRSAGWERIATVVELHPLNHRKAVRMTLGAAPEKRLTSRLGDSDGPMHERSTPNSSALKTGRGQKDKDSL